VLHQTNRIEVDTISSARWSDLLQQFSDASIYQTWPYEAAIHPRFTVSRLVVYKGDFAIGLVQAALAKIPIVGSGVAYIRWGPVWQVKNQSPNREDFRLCLKAIFQEYAVRRRLMVRMVTALNLEDEGWAVPVFEEAGFRFCHASSRRRTIIANLPPSLDQFLAGLHGKWRNALKSGQKKEQELREGQTDEDFLQFSRIYEAMLARKRFETTTSLDAFRELQKQLERREKLTVILCRSKGEWHSGAVISSIGFRGIYLFGATAGEGLHSNGSYLVQWRAIQLLRRMGCREYDLNGINPEANPTTYQFKARLAGKNGREVTNLGMFEACVSPASRLATGLGMKYANTLRALRRRIANNFVQSERS